MKNQHKIYCYLMLLMILSFNKHLVSQKNESVFTFKPSFGVNACQIHGDNFSGFNKFGINAGITVNSRLSNKTSVDLGFIFSQKGARKNQNQEKGDFTFYRVNLNYIELPLLLRHKLNPTYFITLGPSLAYLINYTEDTEAGNWNNVYPFNKFEYGVNFGLGRKIKEKISVEVRSSNSFLPIREYGIIANKVFFPNALARFFNKGLYNNVLSVYLFYHINPKKQNVGS